MNKPISNLDILKWIDKLNIKNFDGVFNEQELPKQELNKAIINLDDINGPGTHWCCIVREGSTLSSIYFDPFGMIPPREVLDAYNRRASTTLKYNTVQYQDKTSVLCGYFCSFFIKKYSEGISPYDILYKELYPFNPLRNEQLIIDYFKNI